jgi:hypothetical protein
LCLKTVASLFPFSCVTFLIELQLGAILNLFFPITFIKYSRRNIFKCNFKLSNLYSTNVIKCVKSGRYMAWLVFFKTSHVAMLWNIIKQCLHWWRLCNNTGDSNSHYLLALATLVDVTQIGWFLFLVASPKVAKASTVMTVPCCCRRQFCFANFANVNDPLTSFRYCKSILNFLSTQ